MTAAAATHDLSFALAAMKGTLLQAGRAPGSDRFAGGAYDSRDVAPGQIFFALPGARVDGFSFAGAAAAAGASVIVVVARARRAGRMRERQRGRGRRSAGSRSATWRRAVRARFAGRVVGVTGSNGKTTTKELVAAALSPAGAVLRTPGSLNTELGLPLTILSATGNEAFWVLEMAMRGRGEIAYLARRRAAAHRRHHQRRRARTSSGSARSRRSRTPRASSSTGSTASPTAAAESRCCRPAIA